MAFRGQKLELWVPKWLCDTSLAPMLSDKLPFSPAWHSWRRMEAPILCHTYFGTQIIFFKGLMRVIRKTEMREFNFWCAAIAQNFLLIFLLIRISRKLHEKHSLWKEKRKSVSLNGTLLICNFGWSALYLRELGFRAEAGAVGSLRADSKPRLRLGF